MTSSEKFCLRWNDFESNISVAFREIREEKDFFDCTLSCGSRQIQAHKLILSACSPFFRSILRQNPHQHPLLYLKGVEFTDLQAVLNFMYHGEVNVAQEELNSFLAVAEDLKVKGLTQNNSNDSNPAPKPKSEPVISSIPRPRPPRDVEDPPAPKRPRPIPPTPVQSYQQDDDDIQEVMPVVKQEPQTIVADPLPPTQQPMAAMTQAYQQQPLMPDPNTLHQSNTVAQIDESYGDDGYDYGGYGEEDQYEGAMMDTSGGGDQNKAALLEGANQLCQKHDDKNFECLSCGKLFSHQSNCKRHIRIEHLGEQKNATCPNCEKQVLKTDIKRHMKKHCSNRHLYQESQNFSFLMN